MYSEGEQATHGLQHMAWLDRLPLVGLSALLGSERRRDIAARSAIVSQRLAVKRRDIKRMGIQKPWCQTVA